MSLIRRSCERGCVASSNEQLAPSDSARRIRRELLTSILVGGVGPYVVYVLLRPHYAEVPSLIAGSLLPTALELASYLRHRRLDPLSTLNLAALGLTILLAATGGSARFLLVKESLVTGAVGIWFLSTLTDRRPAHYYLGRQFAAGNDPERVARYDFAWKAVPQMRDALTTSTAVWGAVYCAELVVRLFLAYLLPTEVVLVVGPLVFYATTLGLIAWTVRRMRRVRRRIQAAMKAPDSLVYDQRIG
ncbi:MAG TPA: VC0807 family protein [Polyangiales bacterium]